MAEPAREHEPPSPDELAALERLTADVRAATVRPVDWFHCPWCATATDAGEPCRAHRALEGRYQQARWGNRG
jgi:hypothetical protein